MKNTRIQKIEKEQLKECAFKMPVYHFTDHELRERNRRLYLAMLMGNNFHSKVKIVFNTMEGYKEVFSTGAWPPPKNLFCSRGAILFPLKPLRK